MIRAYGSVFFFSRDDLLEYTKQFASRVGFNARGILSCRMTNNPEPMCRIVLEINGYEEDTTEQFEECCVVIKKYADSHFGADFDEKENVCISSSFNEINRLFIISFDSQGYDFVGPVSKEIKMILFDRIAQVESYPAKIRDDFSRRVYKNSLNDLYIVWTVAICMVVTAAVCFCFSNSE